MLQLPPIGDLALAATIVGALFLIRFVLTVRRIRAGGRSGEGSIWADTARASRPLAFGREHEPERRSAMRQFYVGALFSVLGLALAGWLVVASVLTPFIQRGFSV